MISTETSLQWGRMTWGEPSRGLYFQQAAASHAQQEMDLLGKVKSLTFPALRRLCQEPSLHTRCPRCTLLPESSEIKVSQASCIPSKETRAILSWDAVPPWEGGAWRRAQSGGGRSRGSLPLAGVQKKSSNSVRFNQPVRCRGAWTGCAERSFGWAPVRATERKQHFVAAGTGSEPAVETGCTPPGVCEDVFFPFCFRLSVTLWLLENPVAQK